MQVSNTKTTNNLSSSEKRFLNNLYRIVEANLSDQNFTIELLVKKMETSKTQLHRKLRALRNQSPSEFVRNLRLQAAYQLLRRREGNVSEIAFKVGFSSPKYFATKFKEKYGISPSKVQF